MTKGRFSLRQGSARLALRAGVVAALVGSMVAGGVRPLFGAPQVAAGATLETTVAPPPRAEVVLRTLRADPEQEYYIYVPHQGGEGAKLFVTVHGTSRNAEEHARLFAPFAESQGVVVAAPFFPDTKFDDYQRLGRAGRGKRSDVALDAIIEEVASLTGAHADKIYLFGFSGGAQFAHRYAMAHPERVARAAVTSAGWYTFPDPRTDYPYGTRLSGDLPGVMFDPEKYLRVPIAVFVGEADTTSRNMRQNDQVDRQQGLTRLERARNWTAAMRSAAEALHLEPQISYQQVPGIGHSFRQFMQEGQLGERVFQVLFAMGSPNKAESRQGADERRHGMLQPPMGAGWQEDDDEVTLGVADSWR